MRPHFHMDKRKILWVLQNSMLKIKAPHNTEKAEWDLRKHPNEHKMFSEASLSKP